jgi:hypothetical protein
LRESHTEKLVVASERAHAMIPAISLNALVELVVREKIHELGKDKTPGVHRLLLLSVKRRNYGRKPHAN